MADDKIPKGRIRRSAKLGSALGAQATRYAGTKAANVARSERAGRAAARGAPPGDGREDGLDPGRDEGSGDEAGPARLLRRHRVPAPGVRASSTRSSSRSCAPRRRRCRGRRWARSSRRSTAASRSTSCSPRSSRRRSPPPRSARCIARRCTTAARSRSRSSTRGSPRRSSRTCATPAMIMRLARAIAPGLDAKAVAEELRLRVMEELDYEYEAQSQRTFARAYRGHPFIYVPRRAHPPVAAPGAGHRVRRGARLRGREAAAAGRSRPLRRDRLPVLLRLDLPPAAVQRRSPPRQLHPDATTAASPSSTSG